MRRSSTPAFSGGGRHRPILAGAAQPLPLDRRRQELRRHADAALHIDQRLGAATRMNLRVALTLLVRDEIDIVATMLDYHLAEGLAPIIVTDNGSVDGTLDVL